MKKKDLLIPFILLLTLFSCSKLEDSDNEFDLKAAQMEQIGGLFDAIARQPEAANVLIQSAEMAYSDYNELLPISDKAITLRGKARGYAFSMLFSAIARQPEAFDVLEGAAEKFLGPYDPDYISKDLLVVTKAYSVSALMESIARQPEAVSLFNIVSKKYLNYQISSESVHVR